MKRVVIAGASGVVGSRALAHLLEQDDVERVVALGRRPLDLSHEKLVSEMVEFQSAEALEASMPEAEVAICALGTTRKKAGSKEAFRAVDRDAVVAFARAAKRKGTRRFLLVSSIGADARAPSFYLRTKGEAEEALAALGFEQLTILRPSFIDDEGTRAEFRLGERLALPLARALFSLVGPKRRYAPIRAETIGKALVRLAFDESTETLRIVESDRLHEVGR